MITQGFDSQSKTPTSLLFSMSSEDFQMFALYRTSLCSARKCERGRHCPCVHRTQCKWGLGHRTPGAARSRNPALARVGVDGVPLGPQWQDGDQPPGAAQAGTHSQSSPLSLASHLRVSAPFSPPRTPARKSAASRSIWWNIKLISAPRRPKRKVRIFLTGAIQHAISNTSKGPVTWMCWDLRYGSEVYTMYLVIMFPWKKTLDHIQLPFRPYWASRARPTGPR